MLRCTRTFHWICSLLTLGCTGVIRGSDDAPADGDPSSEIPGGGVGSDPSTAPLDCGSQRAAVLHARLLTPSQYNHAVEDLLHVGGEPASEFGGGVAALLDEVGVERRANAAALVASEAAANLSAWSPCSPDTVTCA